MFSATVVSVRSQARGVPYVAAELAVSEVIRIIKWVFWEQESAVLVDCFVIKIAPWVPK